MFADILLMVKDPDVYSMDISHLLIKHTPGPIEWLQVTITTILIFSYLFYLFLMSIKCPGLSEIKTALRNVKILMQITRDERWM